MRRRDLIAGLGSAAATWPLAARAQQSAMPVIGFLHPTFPEATAHLMPAFHKGLSESGYVEGRNLRVEYRWAEGHNDRLPEMAADLARRRVAVIAALQGDTSARAAKAATSAIPIVFMSASDAVTGGLVTSLSRPEGNLTGVSGFATELMPKLLSLLCEVMPNAAVIDMLVNPTGAITASSTRDVDATARLLGRQVRVLTATNDVEIDAAFASLAQRGTSALMILGDSFFNVRSGKLAALSTRYGVPAIFVPREFAVAGGLMSYSDIRADSYRQVGRYTGRILKGEKPADLPVQRPTLFEFVVNLKTAKALGLNVPETILLRADEVIQ
jgi:putative tryptophan/tyrosine transport system substrate-binding protein